MATTGNYQINIDGDVSGQIAIGNNNLQIQNHGGVVNIVKPSSRSPFKKRAGSVWHRPRPFPTLLDRVEESQVIQSSVQNGISVSVFGQAGIGKTTFLSHMAHLPETNKYPDGVFYLYVREQRFDDLLQMLFDTFFSSAGNVMPTTGQLRHLLQSVRAVIFLDDLTLARDDAQALIAIMPLSCFVLASVEQSLWGEGEVIPLGGLPEQEQVELFAREIKRPLSEDEKTDALIICYYLQGHPLRIVQAASLVTSAGKTISEIKKQFKNDSTPLAAAQELLNNLSVSQKRALAVLGAAAGALIPLSIIGTLLKLTDVQGVLKSLVDMGLVWNQGSRYGLGGSLVGQIGRLWNLSSWEDTLINYFADWLTQQPKDALIEEASDLLVRVIQKAGEKNLWPEVIRIGRALEGVLILNRRWQAWLDILNLILKAAKADGDRSAEAWALHQLGSRAMCLNNADQALQLLTHAFSIRHAIGDKGGLAVTQHNLNILHRVPVTADDGNISWRDYLNYGCAGVGIVMIFALLFFAGSRFLPSLLATATPQFTSTPTFTLTPSHTPTQTSTDTPTITVTPSLTATFTVTSSYTPTFTFTPSRTATLTVTSSRTLTPMPPNVAPPAPGIISPKAGDSFCSGKRILLDWTASQDLSGIDDYQIQLYRFQYPQWVLLIDAIVSSNPTEYNTPEYGSGVYEWRIRAKDNEGIWGSWSSWDETIYTTSYCVE